MKNHYETLGVNRDATKDEISKAYRDLARKYHPDTSPDDPNATDKFKEISQAHEILSDDEKRAEYDNPVQHRRRGGFNPFDPFADINRFHRNMNDLQLSMELEIDFLEAALGCKKSINVATKELCKACNAIGWMNKEVCLQCNGAGMVIAKAAGNWAVQMACPNCRGLGETFSNKCPSCDSGFIALPDEVVELSLPAGIDNGQSLRLHGKGGYDSQGRRGDLYVNILVKPHEYFERSDLDIACKIPVSYTQLVLGSEITVPTINGKVSAKIPPKTNSGAKLKLKGQGIKTTHDRKGDMFVVLSSAIPKKLPKEYSEKLKELAELEIKYPAEEIVKFNARLDI